MYIKDLGWDAYFEALWGERVMEGCAPARVVSQQRGMWRVAGDCGECWAEPTGKLREQADEGGDWPVVGDWLLAEFRGPEHHAMIQHVLPRRSRFAREAAGRPIAQQVLAANIDLALIVAALDGDFNVRRIERYLTQCWESGARPAIVLNKTDVCAEVRERVVQIERASVGVPVFPVSALTGEGMEALETSLKKGETAVLLGSSGAGKSTLVNRLLWEVRQPMQAVREGDNRGRHTTTSRQLFVMGNGAMIIDTPGLRELGLWNADEGLLQTFAEVDDLAEQCRFRDCRHNKEPGCAVQAALGSGILEVGRFENWRKLQREQKFQLRKLDPELKRAEKKRIKEIMRNMRQQYKHRDKG